MNENHKETTPARRFIVEYDIDFGKTNEHEFELYGFKFEATCISYRESGKEISKHSLAIVCNRTIHNNLWKCAGNVEIQDRIVQFVFDCYYKKLIIGDLLLNQPDNIMLKMRLEEVVGVQLVPKFDFEIPGFSDVTFLIGEYRVYAHKSTHDEFHEFLSYIYNPDKIITETSIYNITAQSHRFGVPYLLKRCRKYWNDVCEENFIKQKLKPFDIKLISVLLDVSEKFGFSEVQEQTLTHMKNYNEIRQVIISPEFNSLGSKSQLAILRSFFKEKN